jgi:hypothetical protein
MTGFTSSDMHMAVNTVESKSLRQDLLEANERLYHARVTELQQKFQLMVTQIEDNITERAKKIVRAETKIIMDPATQWENAQNQALDEANAEIYRAHELLKRMIKKTLEEKAHRALEIDRFVQSRSKSGTEDHTSDKSTSGISLLARRHTQGI